MAPYVLFGPILCHVRGGGESQAMTHAFGAIRDRQCCCATVSGGVYLSTRHLKKNKVINWKLPNSGVRIPWHAF